MLELYPQIRSLHILLIMVSGTLFALRGAAAVAGMRWPRNAVVRYSSYTIDTFLLTTAAMLVTILPRGMFANGWLTVKLILIVFYIVFGILAMRQDATPARRIAFYLLATGTFLSIYSVARLHSPWGWLTPYIQ